MVCGGAAGGAAPVLLLKIKACRGRGQRQVAAFKRSQEICLHVAAGHARTVGSSACQRACAPACLPPPASPVSAPIAAAMPDASPLGKGFSLLGSSRITASVTISGAAHSWQGPPHGGGGGRGHRTSIGDRGRGAAPRCQARRTRRRPIAPHAPGHMHTRVRVSWRACARAHAHAHQRAHAPQVVPQLGLVVVHQQRVGHHHERLARTQALEDAAAACMADHQGCGRDVGCERGRKVKVPAASSRVGGGGSASVWGLGREGVSPWGGERAAGMLPVAHATLAEARRTSRRPARRMLLRRPAHSTSSPLLSTADVPPGGTSTRGA